MARRHPRTEPPFRRSEGPRATMHLAQSPSPGAPFLASFARSGDFRSPSEAFTPTCQHGPRPNSLVIPTEGRNLLSSTPHKSHPHPRQCVLWPGFANDGKVVSILAETDGDGDTKRPGQKEVTRRTFNARKFSSPCVCGDDFQSAGRIRGDSDRRSPLPQLIHHQLRPQRRRRIKPVVVGSGADFRDTSESVRSEAHSLLGLGCRNGLDGVWDMRRALLLPRTVRGNLLSRR